MKFLRSFLLCSLVLAVGFSVASAAMKSVWDIQHEMMAKNVSQPTSRIIRGQLATAGQFKYYVRITIFGGLFIPIIIGWCGGTLIAKDWVLTAAHCITQVDFMVDFQAWYIQAGIVEEDEADQETSLLFIDAHPHPDYDPDTLMNDIGLLKTGDFDFNTLVGTIPVVPANTNPNVYLGRLMTVCGFGLTANDGETPDNLYYTQMRFISFASCQAAYGSDTLPTTSICAEGTQTPSNAVCSGDSGGPVTLTIGATLYIVAVVSYGPDTGCDTAPNGFTNVVLFSKWISDTMRDN